MFNIFKRKETKAATGSNYQSRKCPNRCKNNRGVRIQFGVSKEMFDAGMGLWSDWPRLGHIYYECFECGKEWLEEVTPKLSRERGARLAAVGMASRS